MHKRFVPDKPTTALFVERIMNRESCDNHKVPLGVPCWHIHTTSAGYKPAICNERAIRAGCNSPISEKAVQLNRPPRR